MNIINLIVKDKIDTLSLLVDRSILSANSDYFNNLFNKFKDSGSDKIIINVPNAQIIVTIIKNLLGWNDIIPITKSLIEGYDFLSIDFDDLLEEIIDIEEFMDICDKHGYTDQRIKILSKKLPTDYDISSYPDNLQKLIKYYQYSQLVIAGSKHGGIRIYNSETGKIVGNLNGHTDQIYELIVTTDNKYVLSMSSDHTIKIWKLETAMLVRTITVNIKSFYLMVITSDNKYIITTSRGYTINIWDFATGKNILTITSPMDLTLGFNDDNDDRNINNHNHYDDDSDDDNNNDNDYDNNDNDDDDDYNNNNEDNNDNNIVQINNSCDTITSLTITSDNKYIVIGSSHARIKIWDFETGVLVNTIVAYSDMIDAVVVTTDNKYIVTGSFISNIKIWDFETSKIVHKLTDHTNCKEHVKITSDNKYIISAANDDTIKIWELATGKIINTLTKHKNNVIALAITSDDKQIISGSDDKTINIWDLPTGQLIRSINSSAKINAIAVTHSIPYPE